jgi:hypothetical protein
MHVADCDRCQMLTAALVRTEGLVRTGAEASRVPSWKRRAFNWLDALRDQSATSAEARADRAVPVEGAQPSPNELSRRQVVEQPALKAQEPPSARAIAGGQYARNDAGRRETIQEAVTAEEPGRSAPTAPAASSAGFQARVASGSFEVVSPNSQVRWRIGPGSVVQHSADGGMTWATQQAGATTDLTAGSSPSTDVCWLVGRAGLVLRTIDGGRQWERALFPETVDIFAVTASNALSAAVTSADGRRFQTTDGGRTWVPAP